MVILFPFSINVKALVCSVENVSLAHVETGNQEPQEPRIERGNIFILYFQLLLQ